MYFINLCINNSPSEQIFWRVHSFLLTNASSLSYSFQEENIAMRFSLTSLQAGIAHTLQPQYTEEHQSKTP